MRFDLQSHGMGWRGALFPFLQHSQIDGDIYQFGVAGGFSLQVLGSMMQHIPKKPSYYGFDVFTGMPVENAEPDKQRDTPGSFNLLKLEGVVSLDDAIRLLEFSIKTNMRGDVNLTLIKGLVQETLTNELVKTHAMKPALYVDMDMDIYSPSKFALEWLLNHNLIVPGTIIGFDDWGQCPEHPIGTYGESRAWKESGIEGKLIIETPNHGQTAFIVTAVPKK